MATPGTLTTHVLDTARGRPAEGIEVRLCRVTEAVHELLCTHTTNADGRTNEPLLAAGELESGSYELTFCVGAYLVAGGAPAPPFFGEIPVRVEVGDPEAGLHVPLLLSPFAYSVYRGS